MVGCYNAAIELVKLNDNPAAQRLGINALYNIVENENEHSSTHWDVASALSEMEDLPEAKGFGNKWLNELQWRSNLQGN